MKIRFKTGVNLPLGEILNILSMIIVTSCVFQEDNKYYLQVYLQKCLYEFINKLVSNISHITHIFHESALHK